jgi:peroxiredoxin Q/BCP
VLGVSFDDPAENQVFATAEQFGFRLLSDPTRSVGELYEVVRDADDQYASFPKRISYLIDPGGVVRRAYAVTDVSVHADVLTDLRRLRDEP